MVIVCYSEVIFLSKYAKKLNQKIHRLATLRYKLWYQYMSVCSEIMLYRFLN